MTANELVLPVLECPFESVLHPASTTVDSDSLEWADSHGLFADKEMAQRFRGSKVGWLAGYTNPTADIDVLRIITDWYMLLFAFDDQFCDESEIGDCVERTGEILAGLLAVIEAPHGPPTVHDRWQAAFADLCARLRARATPELWQRFVGTVRGLFLGFLWEAANRAARRMPTPAEYMALRPHSSAVPTSTALTDLATGMPLTGRQAALPEIVAATWSTAQVVAWGNDILSYQKEAATGRRLYSMPVLLRYHESLSLQEAMDRAGEICNQETRRFIELNRRVVGEHTDPSILAYVKGLQFWISGNIAWSRQTRRYVEVKEKS